MGRMLVDTTQHLESPSWLTEGPSDRLTPSDYAKRDALEVSERYRLEIAEKIAEAFGVNESAEINRELHKKL